MHPKKKVTIVIDAAAAESVVALIREAGAKGHTLIPRVQGAGHRGIRRGHDIFEPAQNVLLVVICDPPVAARIVESVMGLLERHAGIVYTSDVEVARADLF
jgi:PII-like signaling protein